MASNERMLPFADEPRSELERTIEELVDRAHRVSSTQGRLRNLLQANRVVVEQLDLAQVLHKIVEAALSLVDARYGALGVIAPDGHLEQFIHVGIPDGEAVAIGHLPEGHGILGAVIESGAPIRLENLEHDPRSVGFPAAHPAMDSFLGVPIRVRDVVFGNLYLTNRASGPFTQEDEDLVTALAATAGIAIENARLFDESRRRQRWSAALAGVTSALLSGESDDLLDVVAEGIASVIDADLVYVIVPASDPGMLRVDIARGHGAAQLQGRTVARSGTLAARALDTGAVASSDGDAPNSLYEGQPGSGPAVALPLNAFGQALGVLTVTRAEGSARFSEPELGMAADFASQASLAIELARARAERSKWDLVEERNRIARDLHDHVIQRLFASGITLQSAAATLPEPARSVVGGQAEMIDVAIAEIRTAIFTLNSRARQSTPTLRHRVFDVIVDVSPALVATPHLTFGGPVDLLVPQDLADDVVGVVREALTNVARHASAPSSAVDITVADHSLTISVTDDGDGIDPEHTRSSGLANLDERASQRGGRFSVKPAPGGGTRLEWTVPLMDAL